MSHPPEKGEWREHMEHMTLKPYSCMAGWHAPAGLNSCRIVVVPHAALFQRTGVRRSCRRA